MTGSAIKKEHDIFTQTQIFSGNPFVRLSAFSLVSSPQSLMCLYQRESTSLPEQSQATSSIPSAFLSLPANQVSPCVYRRVFHSNAMLDLAMSQRHGCYSLHIRDNSNAKCLRFCFSFLRQEIQSSQCPLLSFEAECSWHRNQPFIEVNEFENGFYLNLRLHSTDSQCNQVVDR